MTQNINLPFKLHAVVNEITSVKMEFRVAARSLFAANISAQHVVIKVPVPPNTNGAKIHVTSGKAKYNGAENSLVWKISRFQGDEEFLLSAQVDLTSTMVKRIWSRPPITMEFQVKFFFVGYNCGLMFTRG